MTRLTKAVWAVVIVLAAAVGSLSMAARTPDGAPPHRLGYLHVACKNGERADAAGRCARPLPYPYRGG